jgi:hypothetical protein
MTGANSPLFEIASVLVRLDNGTSPQFIRRASV